MLNEAQYNLDRKAAKISALSSTNLDKYEYLTGEDLGLKPNTIEQARFQYFPLGKIFNKGLSEDDKEGLFKRLKNLKMRKKNQLEMMIMKVFTTHLDQNLMIKRKNNKLIIQTQNHQISLINLESLSLEAKDLMDEIEDDDDDMDINKLAFIGSDREKFNF